MLGKRDRDTLRFLRELLYGGAAGHIVSVQTNFLKAIMEALDRAAETDFENKLLKDRVRELEKAITEDKEVKRLRKEIYGLRNNVAYYKRTYGADKPVEPEKQK